jgi:hypothetical protein
MNAIPADVTQQMAAKIKYGTKGGQLFIGISLRVETRGRMYEHSPVNLFYLPARAWA